MTEQCTVGMELNTFAESVYNLQLTVRLDTTPTLQMIQLAFRVKLVSTKM